MARILTLDGAHAVASAGLVEDGRVIAEVREAAGALSLPTAVAGLMAAHGRALDRIAVTVGPGSFSGLRAALALAQGLGLAGRVPVVGVSVGEAFAAGLSAAGVARDRALWTVTDTKRGRVYLERDGEVVTAALDALPLPAGKVAVAGDAAVAVAARLAGRGADVMLLDLRQPGALGIALAGSHGAGRPALPLYGEAPEARPGPAPRPPPA